MTYVIQTVIGPDNLLFSLSFENVGFWGNFGAISYEKKKYKEKLINDST